MRQSREPDSFWVVGKTFSHHPHESKMSLACETTCEMLLAI